MATTPGFSTVEIARLEIAFWECFELEGSPVEGQWVQQNDTKMKKKERKTDKKTNKASKFWFLRMPGKQKS